MRAYFYNTHTHVDERDEGGIIHRADHPLFDDLAKDMVSVRLKAMHDAKAFFYIMDTLSELGHFYTGAGVSRISSLRVGLEKTQEIRGHDTQMIVDPNLIGLLYVLSPLLYASDPSNKDAIHNSDNFFVTEKEQKLVVDAGEGEKLKMFSLYRHG